MIKTSSYNENIQRRKNTHDYNGAAFTDKGREIIAKHDCFVRCLIHRFSSFSTPVRSMMCKSDEIDRWLDQNGMDYEEAYDYKLIKFVFDTIKMKINSCFDQSISLLELGTI